MIEYVEGIFQRSPEGTSLIAGTAWADQSNEPSVRTSWAWGNSAINANKQQISNWLGNAKPGSTKEFDLADTGQVTGRSLSRSDWQNGLGSKPVHGCRVVLRTDPDAPGGYYILTTFPFG